MSVQMHMCGCVWQCVCVHARVWVRVCECVSGVWACRSTSAMWLRGTQKTPLAFLHGSQESDSGHQTCTAGAFISCLPLNVDQAGFKPAMLVMDGLDFPIFLPHQCWDHRRVSPCQALKGTFWKVHTYGLCATAAGRAVCPVYGQLVSDIWRWLEGALQLDLLSHISSDMGICTYLQGEDETHT